jgi:DNA-directed RNA polymerase subunit RPC12/RpoP
MHLKCFTCGEEFDNVQQLANHKRLHQSGPVREKPKGVICLGCGRPIPVEPSKMNYTGPLTCPSCKRTMKVTLDGGEVVVARLG